jgi:hypothetical protein
MSRNSLNTLSSHVSNDFEQSLTPDAAPAIFGAASKQGGAIGRVGRASGRRQVMLTDLYEKMLPCTAEMIEKVGFPLHEKL